MASTANTPGTMAPILKEVYPDKAPGYEKSPFKRKRRFSKIRQTLKRAKKNK